MEWTEEDILCRELLRYLGKNAPIRSGNLVNHITLNETKSQYIIKISAIRYNENIYRNSLIKGLQATYAGKAPKGREREPKGVVRRVKRSESKYYKYDYAYVTEVKNKSSMGWVAHSIEQAIEEI